MQVTRPLFVLLLNVGAWTKTQPRNPAQLCKVHNTAQQRLNDGGLLQRSSSVPFKEMPITVGGGGDLGHDENENI